MYRIAENTASKFQTVIVFALRYSAAMLCPDGYSTMPPATTATTREIDERLSIAMTAVSRHFADVADMYRQFAEDTPTDD